MHGNKLTQCGSECRTNSRLTVQNFVKAEVNAIRKSVQYGCNAKKMKYKLYM